MNVEKIIVRGAREHNLRSVNVEIPKNKLVIVTGPSGSGKSSLALDTLYAEGRRRYVESLSSYARQFLGVSKKPEVDKIEGLCPAIAIDQKTVGYNPRSTVGTITEIYDYLRVLFARAGIPHCYQCGQVIRAESPQTVARLILEAMSGTEVTITAPIAIERKGEFVHDLQTYFDKGYYRFIIDGKMYRFANREDILTLKLAKTQRHTIEICIDRLTLSGVEAVRIQEAIEKAFPLANGFCRVIPIDEKVAPQLFSADHMCVRCKISFPEMEPRLFSFNSPLGACKGCNGLGTMYAAFAAQGEDEVPSYWLARQSREMVCNACEGTRLRPEARAVTVDGLSIDTMSSFAVSELRDRITKLHLSSEHHQIADGLIREIVSRLTFLSDVGLSYLTLARSARTLSGGEGQRIRLATQIGSALSGVLYVLDEPSIGLHQRDNDRLIDTLKKLRDHGNTVLVVEHDMDTIAASDYVIDMGPGAGLMGGEVVACGTPAEVAANPNSLTGRYMSGVDMIEVPKKRRKADQVLTITAVSTNNLKKIDCAIPLGMLVGMSGVSGSGKSSLIMQTLAPALLEYFRSGFYRNGHGFEEIVGLESLENCVLVDQSPIGRTPRSNPATYLGIFNEIRNLFAATNESKARGYAPGQFSFNVKQGRCENCSGDGTLTIQMHFLEDVEVECKVCRGLRYSDQTLQILFNGKNIADILAMSAVEATEFFTDFTAISKRLKLMCDVGLGYLTLGQSSTTLSGGEAQRIKLVNELAKRGHNTFYILDEPTTGLHTNDVAKLLEVLQRLVNQGNSVLVIEHNLDVLKVVDHLIDIGPDGGEAGGRIVAAGTPELVAQAPESITGRYLKKLLM
ncbi:MAG: excinuclease subunit [Candidatus Dependentiae bacterium]|nr:excinuclease subunit [Candidatus Dependentiae bacterium]